MTDEPAPQAPLQMHWTEGFFINYKGVTSTVTKMPGTCGLYFSSDVLVPEEERGKGLGKEAHRHRLLFLSMVNCSRVFCLVQRTNTPQLRILSKNGWENLTGADDCEDDLILCSIGINAWLEDQKIDYRERVKALENCKYKGFMEKAST